MITRLVGTAVLFGLAAVVFTQADAVWLFLITQTLVLSIVFLSITVVTGLGGYISLCQGAFAAIGGFRSEEHTSELQSLMRISYAVFCLKTKKRKQINTKSHNM